MKSLEESLSEQCIVLLFNYYRFRQKRGISPQKIKKIHLILMLIFATCSSL
jgi:hypothetical protein